MSRGLMYWVIVLIWVILAAGAHFGIGGPWVGTVNDVVLLILFVLLGWNVFGPPVHG
jgi:hypothetical protein